ncbi:MAG: type II toxin-antitoxin system MqsA family antitoxin [Nitrospirae bacterium]|nr:type II toxin-antitoxin system MqsA family antitoxin [Nitrospirota bacterium]
MRASCYFCKGKVVEPVASVDFWWGDDLKIIETVPPGICQQCGEKYFSPEVYKEMERLAKSPGRAVSRLSVDVLRYSPA